MVSDIHSEVQGGIIENSKYCWIASGAILEIFCIKTGSKIASWKFGSFYKSQYTCITSICKIPISEEFGSCLLAIGLCHGVNDGSICIFAIQGCRILLAINIGEPVTKICLVDSGGNLAGPLSAFDGVLAVTTNKENAYLIDLCRQICIDALELGPEYGFDEYHIRQCAKVRPNANYELLKELAMAKDEHIALNIYSVDIIGSVTSLLMVQQISALVIGSNTGAFVIIDLIGFKIIYKSNPMHGAILQITFQEPSDDPRAHCFLWTLHSNGTKTTANFHQLIYRSKDSSGFCRYQEFLNCNLQYTMVLGKIESRIISCQVIQKLFQDECAISVCTFSWIAENKLYLCIFDIDQWYKFGMGNSNIESRLEKIVYNKFQIKLDLDYTKLRDIKLSTNTLSLFKSCQAFDEYYHPGSLTFDCDVLSISKNFCFHWPGSQKQILQKLSNMGSAGLIAPESLYLECLRTHLIPLFHDNSFDCETSTSSPLATRQQDSRTLQDYATPFHSTTRVAFRSSWDESGGGGDRVPVSLVPAFVRRSPFGS
ncbi:protein ELYS [Ctenocephalides felis]|uniref:protein ELYS n=1 Tax=Ctenocephalides felis TaxID=7515 RepID=UPI000E6E4617|nr:protein ELYS [Ctenocephalides felis]